MRISDWSSDVCSSDLLAEQQLLGQWSLQAFLNDARHRTGTHFRVVATIGDPQARRFIDIQLHVLVAELLFELQDELVDHAQDLASLQRRELHDRVEAVAEFRREQLAHHFDRSEEHTSELQSLMCY